MKKVSLKDIADSLGVSKALVSLVLNGKGDERGINKNTQERVRVKAKELNYVPNQYARGLRVGRTDTIGVIVPDISNAFYGKLCKAIEQEAYRKGFNLIISNTYEDVQKEKKLITDLINRNIDGLILASSFDNKNEFQISLESSNQTRYFEFKNFDTNGEISVIDITNGIRYIPVIEDGLIKLLIPASSELITLKIISDLGIKNLSQIEIAPMVDYAQMGEVEFVMYTSNQFDKIKRIDIRNTFSNIRNVLRFSATKLCLYAPAISESLPILSARL